MSSSEIGARARLFANALTHALSLLAAWGWAAEVNLEFFDFGDAGWVALAAVSLLSQHLANAAAAHAQRVLRARLWLTAIAGVALAVAFASVTAHGVEHALSVVYERQRAEAAAPLRARLAGLEAELAANRRALRDLPSDVPGSRLLILQAPLRQAVEADARRAEHLRAQLERVLAPTPRERTVELIFLVLGFAEPAFYWLLSASHATGTPCPERPIPVRAPLSNVQTASQSACRPRRVPLWKRAAAASMTALALLTPGAVTPPAMQNSENTAEASARRRPDPAGGADPGRRRPAAADPAQSRGAQAFRGTGRCAPPWFERAKALRLRGFSYRSIARALDAPKSTIARWLKTTAIVN